MSLITRQKIHATATDLEIDAALGLPKQKPLKSRQNKAAFYGAASIVAEYCNRKEFDADPPFCWQHGTFAPHDTTPDPGMILADELVKPYERYFVKRQWEADALRCYGISATAIGLPIVYVSRHNIARRPGSLLVMPAHSLAYTRHNWKFAEYAQYIAKLSSRFEETVACVHPSCWEKGYWVDELQRHRIPCIRGADSRDENGLRRISALFEQFEFVTSNCWGSHVLYAAAFGAKVSIAGAYANYEAEDYARAVFYQKHPRRLSRALEAQSEQNVANRFPFLFTSPENAGLAVEWGEEEIGVPFKKSPRQLRRLFRPTLKRIVTNSLKKTFRIFEHLAPEKRIRPS